MGRPLGGAAHPGPGPRASLRPGHPDGDGLARPARTLRADRVRRRRHGLPELRARLRGGGVRRHLAARHPVGAPGAELPHAAHLGHGGSEAALPGAAGAGAQDRQLRADGAGRRERRPRHAERRRQAGRPLRAERREAVDLARRRGGPLPGVRLQRPREEAAAGRLGHQRVPGGARLPRLLERDPHREVGDPGRQHRLLQDGRGGGAGREPDRPRGRGVQDSPCSRSTRDG